MRRILIILAAAAAGWTAGAAEPARAEVIYPWCARYTGYNESENCGFTSFPQCAATVSGVGGYCMRNPRYVDGRARYERRVNRRHYRNY